MIERRGLAWGLALSVILAVSLVVGLAARGLREAVFLSQLETEAERRSVELLSQTLNGNIMGALALLGSVDRDVKRDALGEAPPNGERIQSLLEAVGTAHDALGVFIVGRDGRIHSSWDISGRPSTGLNVEFRPYFRTAMERRENVYAAVSLARGDRSLYFAVPVRAAVSRTSPVIGVAVARTALDRVDGLLRGRSGETLLISPQGVVFAASNAAHVGKTAEALPAEALASIREMKQFGAMFENRDPEILSFSTRPGIAMRQERRSALASAAIQWNDPAGDWRLILLEDLETAIPAGSYLWPAALCALVLLVMGFLAQKVVQASHQQRQASRQIEEFGRRQAASAERKAQRAEAAIAMQRARSPVELANRFLGECHRIVGALQGMVYACDGPVGCAEGGPMRLLATYACAGRVPEWLEPGQGLLGQSALDGEIRVLETTDHHSWMIRSGLGNVRPSAVMIAPLRLDDRVLGVVEVGVADPPDGHARDQFTELAGLLALNLEIVRRQSAPASPTEALP